MTRLEFAQMLQGIEIAEGVSIPVAYYEFEQATEKGPPFICYYETGSNDFIADNKNYQRIRPFVVELYTDNKDFALEKLRNKITNAICMCTHIAGTNRLLDAAGTRKAIRLWLDMVISRFRKIH